MFLSPAHQKKLVGFTLVELLIVMGLISIVIVASTPYLLGTLEKRRLLSERDKIVTSLRVSQQRSRVAQGGESYGISFIHPEFYLLLPENKQTSYQHNIHVTSSAELVFFRKLTGELDLTPDADELIIVLESNNFRSQIHINAYGVLNTTTPEPR